MSDEEFDEVQNYYYQYGSPEMAVEALKHYLTSDELLESSNPPESNPGLYLFSRIAELNPGLIREYEALFDKASGKGKTLLIWLLELAGDGQTRVFLDSQPDEFGTARCLEAREALQAGHPFKSNPFNRHIRNGMYLDLLWGEFILTGNQEAVVRIVGVLDWPDRTRERLGDWLGSRGLIPIPYWSLSRRKRIVKRLRDTAHIVCDVDRQEILTDEDLDCLCMMEELAVSRERLEQVTRALPFQLSPEHLMQMSVKATAKWSLFANAVKHPLVLETCYSEAAKRTGRGRLGLFEIVAQAGLTRNPLFFLPSRSGSPSGPAFKDYLKAAEAIRQYLALVPSCKEMQERLRVAESQMKLAQLAELSTKSATKQAEEFAEAKKIALVLTFISKIDYDHFYQAPHSSSRLPKFASRPTCVPIHESPENSTENEISTTHVMRREFLQLSTSVCGADRSGLNVPHCSCCTGPK